MNARLKRRAVDSEVAARVLFVILNEVKDLLKVAIGKRFFAKLSMTKTTSMRTFSVSS